MCGTTEVCQSVSDPKVGTEIGNHNKWSFVMTKSNPAAVLCTSIPPMALSMSEYTQGHRKPLALEFR